jgi:hypothetical protein
VDLLSHAALGSDIDDEVSDAVLASGELVYCNSDHYSRRSSGFAQPILLSVGPEGCFTSDQQFSDFDGSFNPGVPGVDNLCQWELESNVSNTLEISNENCGVESDDSDF